MGRKILVDTNIAIGYIGNRLNIQLMDKLDDLFNGQYHISVNNLAIITLNTKDFEDIEGIKVIALESL